MLIARSGADMSAMCTRQDVHNRFGEPPVTGVDKDGLAYDEYITRLKICEEMRAAGLGMGLAMTWFVPEIILFPAEMYRLCKNTMLGQRLKFVYDQSGKVLQAYYDDERLYFFEREAAQRHQ